MTYIYREDPNPERILKSDGKLQPLNAITFDVNNWITGKGGFFLLMSLLFRETGLQFAWNKVGGTYR